jgi:hypothetical protein
MAYSFEVQLPIKLEPTLPIIDHQAEAEVEFELSQLILNLTFC